MYNSASFSYDLAHRRYSLDYARRPECHSALVCQPNCPPWEMTEATTKPTTWPKTATTCLVTKPTRTKTATQAYSSWTRARARWWPQVDSSTSLALAPSAWHWQGLLPEKRAQCWRSEDSPGPRGSAFRRGSWPRTQNWAAAVRPCWSRSCRCIWPRPSGIARGPSERIWTAWIRRKQSLIWRRDYDDERRWRRWWAVARIGSRRCLTSCALIV